MKFERVIRQLIEAKVDKAEAIPATLRDAFLHLCRAERPPRTVSRLAAEAHCHRTTLERQWLLIAGDDAPKLHVVVTYFSLLTELERFFAESQPGARIPKGLRARARSALGAMPLDVWEAQMLAVRECPIPARVFQ